MCSQPEQIFSQNFSFSSWRILMAIPYRNQWILYLFSAMLQDLTSIDIYFMGTGKKYHTKGLHLQGKLFNKDIGTCSIISSFRSLHWISGRKHEYIKKKTFRLPLDFPPSPIRTHIHTNTQELSWKPYCQSWTSPWTLYMVLHAAIVQWRVELNAPEEQRSSRC